MSTREIVMTKDGSTRPVMESAFRTVWSRLGWKEAPADADLTPIIEDRDGDKRVKTGVAAAGGTTHPSRSASTSDWQDYAKDQGMGPDEADGMTRDQLVDHYLPDGE